MGFFVGRLPPYLYSRERGGLCFYSFFYCPFFCLSFEEKKILSYVEASLPHQGVLRLASNDLLYIELPKRYIVDLLPFLKDENACSPPYFAQGKIGAHITVAEPEEMQKKKGLYNPFLGKSISFSVQGFKKITLQNSEVGDMAYVLVVESPEFSKIRASLELPAKIRNFDFHITVAVDCPVLKTNADQPSFVKEVSK